MADQTTITALIKAKADEKTFSDVAKKLKDLDKAGKKEIAVVKDLNAVLKDMGHDWGRIAKYATSATEGVGAISGAMDTFVKKLGSATTSSLQHLKKLGDELEEKQERAKELAKAWDSADAGAQEGMKKEMGSLAASIKDLVHDIDAESVARHKEVQQITKLVKAQDRYKKSLADAAKFDMGDMFEGIKTKISSGNFKGIFSEIGGGLKKSLEGAYARHGEHKAKEAGTKATQAAKARGASPEDADKAGQAAMAAEQASAAKALGAASMGLGMAVAAIVGFVQLIKAASDHMATLNKSLLQGSTLAGDAGMSIIQYSDAIKDLRNAAIDSAGSMLKLGTNSETSLKIVSAFSKEASGSIITTAANLKDLGGGSMEFGMQQFVTSAIAYGKGLGMEVEEVAGLMGKFVSEIGVGVANVQSTFDSIMKQANQANMPVSKFMDIFRQTIPSVDLYTNRIEELTGTMKMLSKSMSAKDVQAFMNAFGRGFDQLDFKQRLKMTLMVGPAKIGATLQKGFDDSTKSIKKALGEFGDEFEKGMKSADPVEATHKMMGRAMAIGGNDPSTATALGDAAKLARAQRLKNRATAQGGTAGATDMAGAMRGASRYARTQIMEDYATSLGKDIEGLGEHIVKGLGVSEQEYAAILALRDNMGAYTSQAEEVGRTSSTSINDQLKVLMGIAATDEKGFENEMKRLARNDPKGLEDKIKRAASMQFESDDKNKKSVQELAVIQANVTTSISEKIDNIIKFLLEKIFQELQGITGWIDAIYGIIIGGNKEIAKALSFSLEKFKSDVSGMANAADRTAYVEGVTNKATKMAQAGVKGGDIIKATGADKQLETLSPEDLKRFLTDQGVVLEKAVRTANGIERKSLTAEEVKAKLPEILAGIGTERGARISQGIASDKAKEAGFTKPTGPGFDYAQGEATKGLAKVENDPRTKQFYERKKGGSEAERQRRIAGSAQTDLATAANPFSLDLATTLGNGAIGPTAPVGSGATPQQVKAAAAAAAPGAAAPGAPAAAATPGAAAPGAPAAAATPGAPTAAKAPATMIDLLDSINVQVMGISMHADQLHKDLDEIKIDKSFLNGQFKNAIYGGVAKALFEYFLYSADDKKVVQTLSEAIGEGAKDMSEVGEKTLAWWGGNFSKEKMAGIMAQVTEREQKAAKVAAAAAAAPVPKDFGDTHIAKTGEYRLQQGEQVIRRGDGGNRSTVVNNVINVNGAGDPRQVAMVVANEMYKRSKLQ